jgi:colanic acid/amylovoran biosynthesis protein
VAAERQIRVGLLWHSLRSDNLGVGALAVSNLMIVREAARRAGCDVRCTVIGFGGPLHYPPNNVPVDEYIVGRSKELLPGSGLWNAIKRCDIILDIGAGDSWADIYGFKRFLWMWVPKEMALFQRRKLVLSPQTVGPFSQILPRLMAGSTMRRADKIFTRDTESLGFVKKLGAGKDAEETVDVAFRLPFTQRERAADGRIRFGLNVSGLLHAGGYTQKSQFGSRDVYRAMVDGLIGRLVARGDVDVTLVPHVVPNTGSIEDDVAVSHAIAARFPGVTVAPLFTSPSDAKSFISGLDVLAGSRMHATIAAVSSGIAVVPLAYSRKFRGVFHSIDYPLVGDCTSQSAEDLIALTLSAVDRRDELASAARRGRDIAFRRINTYEDYLVGLMQAIAR